MRERVYVIRVVIDYGLLQAETFTATETPTLEIEMTVRKSRLFTNAELEEIERQKKSDHSDIHGYFAGRIRPKLEEILFWSDQKRLISRLLKSKRKKRSI